MSRLDIGDYLGLTIETVSRVFTRLKDKSIIRLLGLRSIEILKLDVLPNMGNNAPRSSNSHPQGHGARPLAEAEKAQYRYHDDHRSDEPNDIVHDLSPVAW